MCAHKHFTAAASRGYITKWQIKALFLLLFPVGVAQFCTLLHSVASVSSADDTTGGQFPLEPFAPQRTHIWWKQEAWCASPNAKGQYARAIVR